VPRPLADYGLTSGEFAGLVLEDPALFDSYVVRMVEDLDLSAHVTAGRNGSPRIVPSVLEESLASIQRANILSRRDFVTLVPLPFGGDAPERLRTSMQAIVRTYVRGPLDYEEAALDQVANVVTAAAYDVLSSGGLQARAEGVTTVKLRHWLAACEHWLYPLNRFC